MHLGHALSDDTLVHALEPLIQQMPEALTTFVLRERGGDESLVRSLIELWLASAFETSPELLHGHYQRVTSAITAIGSDAEQRMSLVEDAVTLLMHALRADADRLPPDRVVEVTRVLIAHGRVASSRGAELALRNLLTPRVTALGSSVAPMWMLLSDHMETLDDDLLVRAFHGIINAAETGDGKIRDLVRQLDALDDGRRTAALENIDPVLAVRLAVFRS